MTDTANIDNSGAGDFASLTIGVLELQGDFAEHTAMLRRCGVGTVIGIRQPADVTDALDGVVLPGGESTAMGKLLVSQHILQPMQELRAQSVPMFGTCAGCILLADVLTARHDAQPRIGGLDVLVERNAYGAQIESCDTVVRHTDGLPLRVVLIRAPVVVSVGEGVEVLASYKDSPILIRQNGLLACTFHPELTKDTRVHELFLSMVVNRKHTKGGTKQR